MAEDWDLYAVVRSCTTARTAGAAGSLTSGIEQENPLASLIFEDDGSDAFGFPNLEQPRNNAFEELNQLYRPFFQVAGDASFSNFAGFELKSRYYAPENEKVKVEDKVSSGCLAKHQTPCVQLQQQREAHHQGIREDASGTSGSVLPMQAAPPQISTTRSRKRWLELKFGGGFEF